MALPVNIDDIVNARTVESVRIELKKGWNPYSILKSVCAFTNDIDEYGGGYVIIGIEEINGIPVLPPIGVEQKDLDRIQREFFKLCQDNLKENIFPPIEAVQLQGKWIIVIWATTGEARPYYASDSPGKNAQMKIFVRHGAITKEASKEQELRLRELATYKHFDDRINPNASISDLNLRLVLTYLQEVNSQLYEEAQGLSFEDLCFKMQIVRGPKENIKPLNLGLLLFNDNPDTFFPGCITNLLEFEDEAGTQYSEKRFKGPIHVQIRNIMEYLNSNILKRHVRKDSLRLESTAFYNYPYQALEEVVVNALYHRSYENPNANEIRIYKRPIKNKGDTVIHDGRRIEILSYPGPLPPIDENALANLKINARNYRNIKLGDWLKNLKLAEKFATGIPTIVDSLEKNGSPKPILSTDIERSHFLVILHIHPDFPLENINDDSAFEPIQLTDIQQKILEQIIDEPLVKTEIDELFEEDITGDMDYLFVNELIATKDVSESKVYYITIKGRTALKTSF